MCSLCCRKQKAIKAVMGLAADDDENAVRMIPRLHCNGCKETARPNTTGRRQELLPRRGYRWRPWPVQLWLLWLWRLR